MRSRWNHNLHSDRGCCFVLFSLPVSKNDVSRQCGEFDECISAHGLCIDVCYVFEQDFVPAEGFLMSGGGFSVKKTS